MEKRELKISCAKCNFKNDVIELQELKDLPEFYNRILIIGKCNACFEDIASLIEIRKSDDKVFIDSYYGDNAIKIIAREKRRIKNKFSSGHNYSSFVYGINKEIRNKKGEVIKIRQYATDYLTSTKTLIKTINTKV